jgi:hypothetical protein
VELVVMVVLVVLVGAPRLTGGSVGSVEAASLDDRPVLPVHAASNSAPAHTTCHRNEIRPPTADDTRSWEWPAGFAGVRAAVSVIAQRPAKCACTAASHSAGWVS